jgi:hypothetical protein
MEVASSSPSSSSKPALRLNPAAVLPTPVTATPPRPADGRTNPLAALLSSFLPRRERPPKQPDPAAPASAARKAEARQLVGCAVPLFRPYVAQLPWHGGARAWLSKLFPRYGHYCGPNWSSGKEAGSVLWDRRPVDHLDFCCYCHDMAYDTHDQAQLLRADLTFLRCLEGSRHTTARDGAAAAAIYRVMCIFGNFLLSFFFCAAPLHTPKDWSAGLKTILIPYRTNLVKLQTGPIYSDAFADFVKRVASSSGRPTGRDKQRL